MEHPVRQHFSYDANEDKSQCRIEECTITLTGNHAANLTRHLQYHHPNQYTIVTMWKEMRKRRSGNSSSTSSSTSSSAPTGFIMTRKSLVDACVELITVNGRPISIVEDSGFRKIIDPILQTLEPSATINTSNIREAIITKARKVRDTIKAEMKNKLISLKIDGVTRQFRSFIGINAQYIVNQKVIIRTLGLKEIFDRHTSENLKNIVVDVLNIYNLTADNIYSVTTDNGANMLKMIRLLKEEQEECSNTIEHSEVDDAFLNDYQDEFFLQGELLFPTRGNNFELLGVRCVAHTLQLAVQDAIELFDIKELLQKIRELIRKLRSPTLGIVLRNMKLPRPILDCPTRWNSTHNMLERLIKLQHFCSEMEDESISEDEWKIINILTETLEPAKTASKKMQYEDLLMGDFYAEWIQCQLSLQKLKNNFATLLLDALKKREQDLLTNKCVLSSVFLDPRYKNLLSIQEKNIAIEHLMDTWKYFEKLNSAQIIQTQNANSSFSTSDDIEKVLLEKDAEQQNASNVSFSIAAALNAFSQSPRVNRDQNVLQYWDKHSFPELRILAYIVHAAPATQVSVERLFSGLKFILNDQRSRLNRDMLDDIMVVRTNTNVCF